MRHEIHVWHDGSDDPTAYPVNRGQVVEIKDSTGVHASFALEGVTALMLAEIEEFVETDAPEPSVPAPTPVDAAGNPLTTATGEGAFTLGEESTRRFGWLGP